MSALPANVARWLREREELEDMVILTEFPPVKKAVPLRKVTVAVGIKAIEIGDSFAASERENEENEYCRNAEITLNFSVHAPYGMGGEACHSAFATIIDCLTFDSGLEITGSGCGRMSEDRETEALVLGAWVRIRANLCPAQSSDIVFPSFFDKTLLCGSHIRNEDIHLSAGQKAFLDSPLVTGTFIGSGEAQRKIPLGFSPYLVFVAAQDMPLVYDNSGVPTALFGMAGGSFSTLGVSAAPDGFYVRRAGSPSAGTVPDMNAAGTVYCYAAIRR